MWFLFSLPWNGREREIIHLVLVHVLVPVLVQVRIQVLRSESWNIVSYVDGMFVSEKKYIPNYSKRRQGANRPNWHTEFSPRIVQHFLHCLPSYSACLHTCSCLAGLSRNSDSLSKTTRRSSKQASSRQAKKRGPSEGKEEEERAKMNELGKQRHGCPQSPNPYWGFFDYLRAG